jgi:hypothetical protein
MQHVLSAVSCPDRQEAVIYVLEAAATTHGDEPRIPDLGEDHQFAHATDKGSVSGSPVTGMSLLSIGAYISRSEKQTL